MSSCLVSNIEITSRVVVDKTVIFYICRRREKQRKILWVI